MCLASHDPRFAKLKVLAMEILQAAVDISLISFIVVMADYTCLYAYMTSIAFIGSLTVRLLRS